MNRIESGVITNKWYQSQVHNSYCMLAIYSACQSALSGCLPIASLPLCAFIMCVYSLLGGCDT